jgi:hypothetical protein
VTLLNNHPIVSATFHGHEHVLGWVHMDSSRVSTLTGSYEEFFTSPAGGYTNVPDIHPARVDYYYPESGYSQGFAAIDVNGPSFTLNFYKDGITTPVYSRTFVKHNAGTTAVFRSSGAQDGWILESRERSSLGGRLNTAARVFRLGDDAARRQYRAILSFNTGDLPDNALLTRVMLVLRRQSVAPSGSNPFGIFKGLMIDVRTGFFGLDPALDVADFQAADPAFTAGPFRLSPVRGSYTLTLPAAAFPFLNASSSDGGLTQLRLRFNLDDNNNGVANFISLFSGNSGNVSYQPALLVTYYLP